MAQTQNLETLVVSEKKISIVTLMGLPGSGKTTLCNELLNQYKSGDETKLIKISFDEFIPLNVQSTFTEKDKFSVNVLTLKANNLLWSAEELLKELSAEVDATLPATGFSSKLKELTENMDLENYKSVILLVDDNNYYKSMRNEFYQIAKNNQVGFCVLYPKTPLVLCQERNLRRANQVPSTVIQEMTAKLEEPNPLQNSFDALCLQIADVLDPSTIKIIQTYLEYSLKNPICLIQPPHRSTDIAKERRICQENEIHQADLVLRKWIHTEVSLASFRLKKEEKRKFCEQLAYKKSVVMNELRSGELKISAEVQDDFGFRKEILCLARNIKIPEPACQT